MPLQGATAAAPFRWKHLLRALSASFCFSLCCLEPESGWQSTPLEERLMKSVNFFSSYPSYLTAVSATSPPSVELWALLKLRIKEKGCFCFICLVSSLQIVSNFTHLISMNEVGEKRLKRLAGEDEGIWGKSACSKSFCSFESERHLVVILSKGQVIKEIGLQFN